MNKALKTTYFAILAMTILWVVMAFSLPAGKGTLVFNISHYVNDAQLELDTATYTNKLGQQFNVTKFKYYIGNIVLRGADGSDYPLPGYYLVNEEDPQTKHIEWADAPAGEYSSISFIIGVDSAHNVTGLQSGALDPVNAMFWTWNTGYVFLKLEGTSPVSKSPGHIIEYHIGGFKEPVNNIRRVKIDFPQALVLKADGHKTVQLKANAAEVLKTPNTIDFSTLSSVTDFTNSTLIADNYKDMFSLIGIDY